MCAYNAHAALPLADQTATIPSMPQHCGMKPNAFQIAKKSLK